jgi:hypothetical protein
MKGEKREGQKKKKKKKCCGYRGRKKDEHKQSKPQAK